MNTIKFIFRKIIYSPFLLVQIWKAENALKEKDWQKLSDTVESVHRRGFIFDKSRFWLGSALLRLERNEEALIQFEKISDELDSIEEEATRHWNHALALYRNGHTTKSVDLLKEKISSNWPDHTYNKARQFLSDEDISIH